MRQLAERESHILLYRPVRGADELIAKIEYVGDEVFGKDHAGMMVCKPSAEEQFVPVVPVFKSRLGVYGRLLLPVFERSAPVRLNMGPKFNHSVGKAKREGLYAAIDRIGAQYGQLDQRSVPVYLSHLQLDMDRNNSGELSLGISPADTVSRMLIRQAGAVVQYIGDASVKVGFPRSRAPLSIPFMPEPALGTQEQTTEFFSRVNGLLPARVELGGVEIRSEN